MQPRVGLPCPPRQRRSGGLALLRLSTSWVPTSRDSLAGCVSSPPLLSRLEAPHRVWFHSTRSRHEKGPELEVRRQTVEKNMSLPCCVTGGLGHGPVGPSLSWGMFSLVSFLTLVSKSQRRNLGGLRCCRMGNLPFLFALFSKLQTPNLSLPVRCSYRDLETMLSCLFLSPSMHPSVPAFLCVTILCLCSRPGPHHPHGVSGSPSPVTGITHGDRARSVQITQPGPAPLNATAPRARRRRWAWCRLELCHVCHFLSELRNLASEWATFTSFTERNCPAAPRKAREAGATVWARGLACGKARGPAPATS